MITFKMAANSPTKSKTRYLCMYYSKSKAPVPSMNCAVVNRGLLLLFTQIELFTFRQQLPTSVQQEFGTPVCICLDNRNVLYLIQIKTYNLIKGQRKFIDSLPFMKSPKTEELLRLCLLTKKNLQQALIKQESVYESNKM